MIVETCRHERVRVFAEWGFWHRHSMHCQVLFTSGHLAVYTFRSVSHAFHKYAALPALRHTSMRVKSQQLLAASRSTVKHVFHANSVVMAEHRTCRDWRLTMCDPHKQHKCSCRSFLHQEWSSQTTCQHPHDQSDVHGVSAKQCQTSSPQADSGKCGGKPLYPKSQASMRTPLSFHLNSSANFSPNSMDYPSSSIK